MCFRKSLYYRHRRVINNLTQLYAEKEQPNILQFIILQLNTLIALCNSIYTRDRIMRSANKRAYYYVVEIIVQPPSCYIVETYSQRSTYAYYNV